MLNTLRSRCAAAVSPRLIRPRRPHSRWFSSSRAWRSGQFTVVVPSAASQQSVLDAIRRSRHQRAPPETGGPDNAAVVLATPALAAWLEDDAFLSQLLGLLPVAARAAGDVSVLGAVVDGLAPPRPSADGDLAAPALPGLAVLHGDRDTLLPGLWADEGGAPRSAAKPVRPDDVEAAVTVRMPPLPLPSTATATTAALDVTVPLAHTVFQNGRRSTLLASRWTAAADHHGLRRAHTETRVHQRIVPPAPAPAGAPPATTAVAVPLLALAPPRTIAASLGNIVRQVHDGSGAAAPVPASRELEAVIPALLAARRAAQPDRPAADGPLGVWALVVPAAAQEAAQDADLRADSAGHAAAVEQQAAARASAQFTALLAAGCRLHKILSGGGGWGRKQGLLSLDPQMSHPATAAAAPGRSPQTDDDSDDNSDDEAMLSFIRSFQGGAADGGRTGQGVDAIAVPGSRVQFFVAPQRGPASASASRPRRPAASTDPQPPRSLVLGSASGAADGGDSGGAVVLLRNHFGAVAEQGLFLAAAALRTKLDVPDAYVWAHRAVE